MCDIPHTAVASPVSAPPATGEGRDGSRLSGVVAPHVGHTPLWTITVRVAVSLNGISKNSKFDSFDSRNATPDIEAAQIARWGGWAFKTFATAGGGGRTPPRASANFCPRGSDPPHVLVPTPGGGVGSTDDEPRPTACSTDCLLERASAPAPHPTNERNPPGPRALKYASPRGFRPGVPGGWGREICNVY